MICEVCKTETVILHVSPASVSYQIGVCRSCYLDHHKKVYPIHDLPYLPEDEVAPPEEELQEFVGKE